MRNIFTLLLFAFFLVSADVEVSDVNYKSNDTFLKEEYILNGVGIRDKFIFDIYTIGLYLKEKSSDGFEILESKTNKFVRIVIVSSLVTANKFSDGLDDGFEKSTEGNITPIKKEIELLRKGFGSDFKKGEEFIVYFDKSGETKIYKSNNKPYIIPPSRPFQKALLGMWIGKHPVLDDLKVELLGID
jgi:hypothetical protein